MDLDFTKDILLENDRVLLRPLDDDYDHLLPIAMQDKHLLQFSPAPIYTPVYLQKYIDTALKERNNGTRYPFIIYDKKNGKYAGSTSYLNISNKDERLEIGSTWLGKDFQRTGLNKNCKYLLLQYAFDELGFKRVELKTDERNKASRAAIEHIGGIQEGILRSHTVLSDGFRRNTVYYGILKNEWNEMKEHFFDHH